MDITDFSNIPPTALLVYMKNRTNPGIYDLIGACGALEHFQRILDTGTTDEADNYRAALREEHWVIGGFESLEAVPVTINSKLFEDSITTACSKLWCLGTGDDPWHLFRRIEYIMECVAGLYAYDDNNVVGIDHEFLLSYTQSWMKHLAAYRHRAYGPVDSVLCGGARFAGSLAPSRYISDAHDWPLPFLEAIR